ncbi:RTA1-domain-containing protein [Zopfia rhizophila CBS 207.26]|uniref:RTA1-domain-containing protein n=1 Tax=Zopfia rhizophila CBS 207.26 TaxID=1314779 RepID=A0A6A6DLL9_9PEZI|nr:RTA1-domain-containing protein [Zopfia rhizophila CBS 207.26]
MPSPEEEYYSYPPSVPAAVIFVIIFVIFLLIHLFRMFKNANLVLHSFLEVIGYIARAAGHYNRTSLPLYILQALLILLAPILFAASVYMFLSRLIRFTGTESHSMIRVTWLTKIFVGGDILCFLIQGAGGGILSGADTRKSQKLGEGVILAGLIIQILIFGVFVVVAMVWQRRISRGWMGKSLDVGFSWEWYLRMLYVVSVLITVRNLFRVVEYAMGEDGYLLSNEWPIYVFDALLMVIVLGICCLWYVGQTISKSQNGDIEMRRDSDRFHTER